MDSQATPSIAAALEQMVRTGAPATQIASAVAETWRQVDHSLTAVIGPQGVLALYKRSLMLTARAHPWLGPQVRAEDTVDVAQFTAALAQQESHIAALAGGDFLQIFYGLVNSLLGPSLTRRLLGFMWQSP
ncbi:MAG: hypothetical protein M3Z31_05660 [Pseudomonadota bacterium]|nr:hypothetical protein [Pseudomonadota bacterium]